MKPFEESLADLEKVVRDLEEGELGLDEALARYEYGIGLVRHCHGQLRAAEQRIMLLTGLAEDGTPAVEPFRHEATAKPAPTRKKKASKEGPASLFGETADG
jgi:exodeoxyribonuclease VII small subunit